MYIPKTNGKKRPLSIPTVKDRITQTAIKIVIEPIFELQFEPNSFGFRPDKSAHNAVDEIVKYLNFGCEHVIDADISACFDNIDKHKLMVSLFRLFLECIHVSVVMVCIFLLSILTVSLLLVLLFRLSSIHLWFFRLCRVIHHFFMTDFHACSSTSILCILSYSE